MFKLNKKIILSIAVLCSLASFNNSKGMAMPIGPSNFLLNKILKGTTSKLVSGVYHTITGVYHTVNWSLKKYHNWCFWSALRENNIDTKKIKKLLQYKDIDVNKLSYGENELKRVSPLSLACYRGNIEVVKLLLQKGADVNKADKDGQTPLHEACSCFCGKLDIVKVLLQNGADVNKANKNGLTPLYWACCRGKLDIVKCLLQNGAQINKGNDNEPHRHCQTCIMKFIVVNGVLKAKPIHEVDYIIPLYQACKRNNLGMVKYLVQNGAQIDKRSIEIAFNRKVEAYFLNAKKFDSQKKLQDKTKFVINKVKKIKLDNNKEKQEVIDLIRLAFCRSIFETIEKQELHKNTTFYILYQLCKSK
ncbi:ankyrin repeat domain-containing protein, partial [Candidatus Dependentiae bacterium]